MMPADRPPVVVIGGGLAGLTAASLLAGEAAVTLLEASATPGGQVRSRRSGPWLFECGAHTITGLDAELGPMLDRAGVVRQPLSDAGGRRYLVDGGRLVAVPGTATEMVSSPLLSVSGRLRLLKEPLIARGGDPEESVAAFARRRMGEEAARRFVEPVVAAATGGDPSRLLARYALADPVRFEQSAGSILKGRMRAVRAARRSGTTPAGPWSTSAGLAGVAQQLAAGLGDGFRPRCRAVAIGRRGRGFEVRLADGQTLSAAGVVLALPAPALAALDLGDVAGPDLTPLAAIPHVTVAAVSLGFRRDQVGHQLDGFGAVVPPETGLICRSIIFDSNLFAGRAPADHVLVSAQVGGVGRPAVAGMTDHEVQQQVERELAPLLGLSGAPVVAAVDRWPEALPQMVAGHGVHCALADAFEQAVTGVVFSGGWRDGLAIADVMRGGCRAAERLRRALEWRSRDSNLEQ